MSLRRAARVSNKQYAGRRALAAHAVRALIYTWRAHAYDGMHAGDVLMWRTTRVPHASAELLGPPADEPSAATFERRQSVDLRCVCVPPGSPMVDE